ncbi:MAG: alpha/beta hydrolase [Butyrivibrio sp.]
MEPLTIILIILGAVLVLLISGFVAMLIITRPIAQKVYEDQLVKTSPDKWGRVCSAPENEEQLAMWNSGCEWAGLHKERMQEVSVENDGLKLYGEFYDFGSNKCVIILPGRCECLKYSYYFAKPYSDMGMNVLVTDARAHGKSDGKYSTIGVKESGDLRKWIELLESKFHVDEVWLHGVCIGSASAVLVMSSPDCPDSIRGLVTEGCFTDFRDTFKRHMTDINKPWFPVLDEVMLNIKKYGDADVYKAAPIRHIGKIKQRVLFLYGEQDKFSVPKNSRRLFKKCGSSDKKIVWFDKGAHSHLRINNLEKYDNAIIEFISETHNGAPQ